MYSAILWKWNYVFLHGLAWTGWRPTSWSLYGWWTPRRWIPTCTTISIGMCLQLLSATIRATWSCQNIVEISRELRFDNITKPVVPFSLKRHPLMSQRASPPPPKKKISPEGNFSKVPLCSLFCAFWDLKSLASGGTDLTTLRASNPWKTRW